jgi:hypothetical protein
VTDAAGGLECCTIDQMTFKFIFRSKIITSNVIEGREMHLLAKRNCACYVTDAAGGLECCTIDQMTFKFIFRSKIITSNVLGGREIHLLAKHNVSFFKYPLLRPMVTSHLLPRSHVEYIFLQSSRQTSTKIS